MTPDQIAEAVDQIAQAVQPERIVLFGSRDREDARPDSDLDLLVVSRDPFTPHHKRLDELRRIRQALRSFPLLVDVLLYSRDEIEDWRQSPNHVIAQSLRDSVTLYERLSPLYAALMNTCEV
jgi:uncharacterized protein